MTEFRPYVSKRRKKDEPSKTASDSTVMASSSLEGTHNEASMDSSIFKEASCNPGNSDVITRSSRYSVPKSCVKTFTNHKNAVNRIRWSSDTQSDLLLSASMDSTMMLFKWNKSDSSMLKSLDVHSGAVKDARWSNDSKCILSGGYDRHARITDAETGIDHFVNHADVKKQLIYLP